MDKILDIIIASAVGLLSAYVSFRIFVSETRKDIEFLKQKNSEQDTEIKDFRLEHKAMMQALNDNTFAIVRLQAVVESLTKIIDKKL